MNRLQMLQHPAEIEPFLGWVKILKPRAILEIGTGPGGLTQRFCELAPRVVSIDLPSGSSTGSSAEACTERNLALRAAHPGFRGILGNSHDPGVWRQVHEALEGYFLSVDLLFIDGDHYYEGVKKDFMDYRWVVSPGGWVAFHDLNAKTYGPEVEVWRLWDELQGTKEVWSADATWGGIGAIQL